MDTPKLESSFDNMTEIVIDHEEYVVDEAYKVANYDEIRWYYFTYNVCIVWKYIFFNICLL